MLFEDDVQELLESFPPVEFAFAYGSGVVEQGGYKYAVSDSSKLPMLDLILVVDNSEEWHAANKKLNASHYTPLIPIGPRYIAQFQERISSNLWFNAYIPMKSKKFAGRLMKYGVISKQHALDDLNTWNRLYIAGRLQKPVHVLKANSEIAAAMESNLESAVRTSLLMLPDKFQEIDLYLSIASLSYVGDPRMYLGENPKKVTNLVTPIVPHYTKLYQGALGTLSAASIISINRSSAGCPAGTNSMEQDTSVANRWALSTGLPAALRQRLGISRKEQQTHPKPPTAAAVRAAVGSIVGRAATLQTMKGLFTAGMFKSSKYALAKMGKRFFA